MSQGMNDEQRLQATEERIAHLMRAVEEMSDLLRAQDQQITRLQAQMAALIAREAERAQDGGGTVTLADERPPHW